MCQILYHLGNVRLTFTTAAGGATSSYMATMETENAGYEEQVFSNVAETRQIDQVYNHTGEELTATGTANASARLNATEGKAMGPSWTSLHSLSRTRFGMMPGDTVRMSVYAKYNRPTKTKEAISGMAGIIAGAITGGAGNVEGIQQISRSIGETLKGGQAALLAKNNDIPKAYLNYIFFDKEMKSKSTSFTQVTEAAHGSFEQLEMEFIAKEEGYLMAYTSNQTNEDLNVFMDDMMLTHTTGPIVRVDDYYPFGLTFNSSKLDGKLTNKFLYNGKEKEELTDWYDYGARMYDAALGRWFAIDPSAETYYSWTTYNYCANNPILLVDPNGMDWFYYAEADDEEPTWHWHDGSEYEHSYSYTNEDGETVNESINLQGVNAVVVFEGSVNETLGTKGPRDAGYDGVHTDGYIDGDGAITASVTVYGPDGADDISNYTGYTMSSNSDYFGLVANGIYDVNIVSELDPGPMNSLYSVYDSDLHDLDGRGRGWLPAWGGYNPAHSERGMTNGYLTNVFIHRTNNSGWAGTYTDANGNVNGVSEGCLLIQATQWNDFVSQLNGATSIKTQIIR